MSVARWGMLAAVLAGSVVLVVVVLQARQAGSEQPIRFSHRLHTRVLKCVGCHAGVATSAAAGAPRLADCLDCHEGAQATSPEGRKEEAKLQAYATAKREIPWVPVTTLASHTFFSHRRHVALAKAECATCHGAIAQTDALPATPLVGLTMTRCMDCHRARGASLDCLACHR